MSTLSPLQANFWQTDLKEGLSLLEGIEKDVTNEVKKARTLKLDEVRYKPVYENKVERIDEAIRELQALPGTGEFVTKLEDLKKNAERWQKRGYGYSTM